MPEARDGDKVIYQTCTDPDCPALKRLPPNTDHVHLISVERQDGEQAEG